MMTEGIRLAGSSVSDLRTEAASELSQDTFADKLFAEADYCELIGINELAAAFVVTGSSDPTATDQGWSAGTPQALCEQQLYSVDGDSNDVIDIKVVIEPVDQGTGPGEAIDGRVPRSWVCPRPSENSEANLLAGMQEWFRASRR